MRCGLPKHRWQWCRKEISISSTRKKDKKGKKKEEGGSAEKKETATAVSSVSRKRSASDDTVSVGIHTLPVEERILANLRFKAGDSKRVRTVSGVKAEEEQRLFEINSTDEENM